MKWKEIFKEIERIESLPVLETNYTSAYNVLIDSSGCVIEYTGYAQGTVVEVNGNNRKECTLKAIYLFNEKYGDEPN